MAAAAALLFTAQVDVTVELLPVLQPYTRGGVRRDAALLNTQVNNKYKSPSSWTSCPAWNTCQLWAWAQRCPGWCCKRQKIIIDEFCLSSKHLSRVLTWRLRTWARCRACRWDSEGFGAPVVGFLDPPLKRKTAAAPEKSWAGPSACW